MNKLYRLSLLTTICFLALFVFTSSVYALFDSNVKKAKEFMQAEMYPQAIALLEKEISEEPTNADAHFQLGICYINQNKYSGADERFASAVKLKPDYGYKIGKEFKKASDDALKKENLSSASALFDKAIIYDPSYKKQGYEFFMSLGNRSQSEHYYDQALHYANKDKEKNKRVGFKYLTIAVKKWPGSRCESLKQKASSLIGNKIVQEVFPSPYMRTIFEKKYTYADAFEKEHGQIYTIDYDADDIQVGDEINVIAKTIGSDSFTGDEIWIEQGKDFNPPWIETENGTKTINVNYVPKGKRFAISLGGRKDVEVSVTIKRKTIPGPDLELLSTYLIK